uniref:MHC class II antigen alpha chain n=1 Tax=Andrias davidianus TaxID=141262 RepID=U5QB33_ANDDA|nr:MHC class II antigen alpha chain [Andrias davidianus]
MAAVRCLLPFCALLLAPGLGAIQFDHVESQAIFVQTQKPTGEYIFEYDKDELFHVDADRKEAEWRNPAFKDFPTVDIQGALGNFAVMKTNLEIWMKRSNNTPATNAPEVPTLPSEAADTLVCALGLAVGIIGIIMGTVLIIKGMKHNPSHRRRMK